MSYEVRFLELWRELDLSLSAVVDVDVEVDVDGRLSEASKVGTSSLLKLEPGPSKKRGRHFPQDEKVNRSQLIFSKTLLKQ